MFLVSQVVSFRGQRGQTAAPAAPGAALHVTGWSMGGFFGGEDVEFQGLFVG